MKKMMMYGMLATGLFIASCSENPPTMPDTGSNEMRNDAGSISTTPWNPNGNAIMNLYYNGTMVTSMYRMSDLGTGVVQHPSDNILYTYLDDSVYDANHVLHTFIPVTNAFDQADKKIWSEMHVVFNRGFEAHQFTSAAALQAAANGLNPEITIVPGTRTFVMRPMPVH